MSDESEPPVVATSLRDRVRNSKIATIFAIRDFRLMWTGAFIIFTGSWVQIVAQGYFVYQLTGEESKLALVNFANSMPVFVLGFIAGSLADSFDKKKVLIACQALFAVCSGLLATLTYRGEAQYWHVLAVSFFLGIVACVEMPTRQSVVSRVVPMEQLAAAVPINAMTFNAARIAGPAIGGMLLAKFGVSACYLLNSMTFFGLIAAVAAIKTPLKPEKRQPQPIKDLVFEGALYTYREHRLKLLLILESITAVFGIVYVTLIPAYVVQAFGHHDSSTQAAKVAIGNAYTSMGAGAIVGLLLAIRVSDSPRRGRSVVISMVTLFLSLIGMSLAKTPVLAYACFAVAGASTLTQFNTTNALFQILSPERLRGRVLAMRIWALNGLSPFGIVFLGWLATQTRATPLPLLGSGVEAALRFGSVFVGAGALYGFTQLDKLSDLTPATETGKIG